jgi:putative hydrolase of the HAD superfamily
MTIDSLIFDFDGLILDTETPELEVWKSIYAEYGQEYPMERGVQNVGYWGISFFDSAAHLHELTHDSLDVAALRTRHHEESGVLIAGAPILDGVLDVMSSARQRGLRLAVASSSPRSWVEPHLTRLGLIDRFETIVCSEDVPPGRTKPHPDIYFKTLTLLEIRADQAIAFEDSPPGVRAAHAAGIFVVAVPNATTARLKIEGADLMVDSMASLSLENLLEGVTNGRR